MVFLISKYLMIDKSFSKVLTTDSTLDTQDIV
jgi:hypothetical protein